MYIGQTILFMRMCEFSSARALLTKTIPSEDVSKGHRFFRHQFTTSKKRFTMFQIGSVFSMIALFAATMPLASNPTFRELYEATIDTFPSAFLLLGASIGLVLAFANVGIFTQRRKLLVDRKGREINEGTGGDRKKDGGGETRSTTKEEVKDEEDKV